MKKMKSTALTYLRKRDIKGLATKSSDEIAEMLNNMLYFTTQTKKALVELKKNNPKLWGAVRKKLVLRT